MAVVGLAIIHDGRGDRNVKELFYIQGEYFLPVRGPEYMFPGEEGRMFPCSQPSLQGELVVTLMESLGSEQPKIHPGIIELGPFCLVTLWSLYTDHWGESELRRISGKKDMMKRKTTDCSDSYDSKCKCFYNTLTIVQYMKRGQYIKPDLLWWRDGLFYQILVARLAMCLSGGSYPRSDEGHIRWGHNSNYYYLLVLW